MNTVPRHLVVSLSVAALVQVLPVAGPQLAGQTALSVESLFGGGEWTPQGLPAVRWAPDGERLTFLAPSGDGGTDLLAFNVGTGEQTRVVSGSAVVPPGERAPVPIDDYEWSPDGGSLLLLLRSESIWRRSRRGYFYVFDLAAGSLRPISPGRGWQQYAKFSPSGDQVGFVRDNDLFVVDLATGEERALTSDGSDLIVNGTFDWVYEEELGLSDGWRWSPDGRRIAFWRLDQTPIKTFNMIDDGELYAEAIPLPYPKAGDPNSFAAIGVVDMDSGETAWMDTGDNPDTYLARMEFAGAGRLLIQRLNRSQNRLEVLLADPATGESDVLLVDTSDTWVDVDDHLRVLPGDRGLTWTSEREGHNHLYRIGWDGSWTPLTTGAWDLTDVSAVSEDGRWIYVAGSADSPLESHLYRVPAGGDGRVTALTDGSGTHATDVSPGGRYVLDTYSRAGDPPRISVLDGEGRPVRELVDNADLRNRLAEQDLTAPEFFRFTTDEGVELNGWMIKPPDFDSTRRYPVLLYVYGGPGSQTVTDSWGGSRYLWHQLLAGQGYVVASVDGRGTGRRGTAFKNATYLNLGELEARDQVAAAEYFSDLPFVDGSRIGIWGWSYGGYMTLMSLAAGSDLFRAGVSVAPVTHWKFYDTIYTERYMGTPRTNSGGYASSAPLEKAADIDAELLLVHGIHDDNVHFQNSVQMVERLQAAGKQFDFMAYPGKNHSIGGSGTQIHLYTMMLEWLNENLKGRPAAS